MARGRMLMLAAGMRMGQQRAEQQAAQAEAYRQQGAQEAMAQQSPVTAPAQDDVIAQIERLAALHQSGALTDEEFAAAKKKLLG